MAVARDRKRLTPEGEVRACIARLAPKSQTLFRSVRAAFRKRLPTANELAYDYSHSFVIGYSPTGNGIDAIIAISGRAGGVFLYFNQGPKLHDPKRVLMGSGKQTRFIQLEAISQLKDPDVEAFISATIDQAKIPLPSTGKGRLIFKSAVAKKRTTQRGKK